MEAAPDWRELVAIARVARAQGRKGEVAVNPLTDFPNRFQKLSRVFTDGDDGSVFALPVEWVREQGGRPILKFQGISEIGEAERLSGRELRILESELEPLPEGSYYQYRVRGCAVWDRQRGHLGVVAEIMTTGGTDLLVVRNAEGEETLIPLCEAICKSIDIERSRVEVEVPEGLVALNAD
jgi:16S rRNA processing protein RimM